MALSGTDCKNHMDHNSGGRCWGSLCGDCDPASVYGRCSEYSRFIFGYAVCSGLDPI